MNAYTFGCKNVKVDNPLAEKLGMKLKSGEENMSINVMDNKCEVTNCSDDYEAFFKTPFW